eukprot:GHVS01076987.1.p1 GENE.GHVS01076987.1~~GHVS01076987.1.p1  ORF type:complete len:269 (+),score=25.83 GHVS01076987.1:163-969(+)
MRCLRHFSQFWNRLPRDLSLALSSSTDPMASGKCADPTRPSSMFNILPIKSSSHVPSHCHRTENVTANVDILVVAGPSGVGKGTLVKKLIADFPDCFGFCVSHTSRPPRTGEVYGKHYFFEKKEFIMDLVAKGQFLEHAEVHGNVYGTSLQEVGRVSSNGKICLVEVDVQGVRQIKSSPLGGMAHFIFIRPPSLDTLTLRLRNRGTEGDDAIGRRVKAAEREMDEAEKIGFELVVINDVLDQAYAALKRQTAMWFALRMKSHCDEPSD